MLAGIITENEHEYDQRVGLMGKFVRIIPKYGYLLTETGIDVSLRVFAQTFDEQGNEKLIEQPTLNNVVSYTDAEVDAMFSSFNSPILPSDPYQGRVREMMQAVLLQDTMAKGYFGGDTCVPYVPST